jgi:choline dehydrogenase-like flavoprotein
MAALKQVGDTLDFSLEEAVPDIAKSARLRAAMTQLDKNFIGVLFTTNTNAANAPTITTAITLLNTLQNTWRGFKRDYAGVGGAEWTSYFSLLDQDLEKAKTILTQAQSIADNEPQNLMVAHEAMENFRNLLSQLRAENQVDYAMDTVTRLHHAMEPLVGSIVNVSTPAEMSPDVISALLTHFPPFLDELNQLAQRDINAIAQQYHFSEQKKQILIQALSGQQNNMQAITKAYQNNDMTAVLQGIQKNQTTVCQTVSYIW